MTGASLVDDTRHVRPRTTDGRRFDDGRGGVGICRSAPAGHTLAVQLEALREDAPIKQVRRHQPLFAEGRERGQPHSQVELFHLGNLVLRN
jgi:hypothetical protein